MKKKEFLEGIHSKIRPIYESKSVHSDEMSRMNEGKNKQSHIRSQLIQYQFDPIESEEKQGMKSEMRIKDFYEKVGQSNRFVILPDPALPKPANGHPMFTFLNGDFRHGLKVRKFNNTIFGGDPDHGSTI